MAAFLTALQFLTRIRLGSQIEWLPQTIGRSLLFFPIVGCLTGLIYAAVALATSGWMPPHIRGTVIVFAWIFVTGGLFCDGFMDTADGVFSGRSRERMLEIMKDSRVGSNGVIAFVLLALAKWSLIVDMPEVLLLPALFIMPILSRLAVVVIIRMFPSARMEGLGFIFASNAGSWSIPGAMVFTLLCSSPLLFCPVQAALWIAVAASIVALLLAVIAGRYLSQTLGGLTGDTYGAIAEISEIAVLATFAFSIRFVLL